MTSFMDFVKSSYQSYTCVNRIPASSGTSYFPLPIGAKLYTNGVACFTETGILIDLSVLMRGISSGNIIKK